MKKRLNVPSFKNEAEERAYWAKLDLTKHFSVSDFEPVAFPNLKPTSQAISIRLPMNVLIRLKERANEQMIPYQTLIKSYIAHGLTTL
jgi:predicted DNA binding CopG/RHH family protein